MIRKMFNEKRNLTGTIDCYTIGYIVFNFHFFLFVVEIPYQADTIKNED